MARHLNPEGQGKEQNRETGRHQATPDRVVEDLAGFRIEEAGREERGVGNLQTGGRDD
jgi:hypothetical protein